MNVWVPNLRPLLYCKYMMTTTRAFSGEAVESLRWLHVNLIQSRGVSLSEEQLQQLALAVGDDAVRSDLSLRLTLLTSCAPPASLTHDDALRIHSGVRHWHTRR